MRVHFRSLGIPRCSFGWRYRGEQSPLERALTMTGDLNKVTCPKCQKLLIQDKTNAIVEKRS